MASVRGILNIQSLNELTYDKYNCIRFFHDSEFVCSYGTRPDYSVRSRPRLSRPL
jgi:hypothetical protein